MVKPYDSDWVLRTVLFVPGHLEKFLVNAASSDADCLVLDLEDAVPAGKKAEARETIRQVLEKNIYGNKTVFVRANPLHTGWTERDIKETACAQVHGYVFPRFERPQEMANYEDLLLQAEQNLGFQAGYFSITAVIETPLGVLNCLDIAGSSRRLIALIFGCEDFLAELQGRHCQGELALRFPRAQVAAATRAAGIEPIDSPYVQVHDLTGLKTFAEEGRNLGMGGMCAMSPRQIPIIRQVFSPSPEEIQFAKEVLEAEKNALTSDRGVLLVKGKFISPPTVKAAKKIIERQRAIELFEEFIRKQ